MTDYNILDFGVAYGDSLQTAAIQAAVDCCFLNGGGRVVVPEGIYRVGSIRLRSNVTLYLKNGAVLKGSTNPEDYGNFLDDTVEPLSNDRETEQFRSKNPCSRWNNAIIKILNAENVAVIGEAGATIDGGNCYDPAGEEGYRGPHGIMGYNSRQIHFEGYTVKDSANWAHNLFECQHITAKNLTVYGGHDGFDVRTCDDILIEDCHFYSGDDAIAGFDNNDVVIRNCILNSACSNLRLGGHNVLVENCRAYGPARFGHRLTLSDAKKKLGAPTDETSRHNTLTFFLYYCDFRAAIRETPGDIVIRNCTVDGVDALFELPFNPNEIWCCNRSLSSIRFENCTVSGTKKPIFIRGDEQEPLAFSLKDTAFVTENDTLIDAEHFSRISLDGVTVRGADMPKIVARSEGKCEIRRSSDIKIEKAAEKIEK